MAAPPAIFPIGRPRDTLNARSRRRCHAGEPVHTVCRRRRADPAPGAGGHLLRTREGQAEEPCRLCRVPPPDPRAGTSVQRLARGAARDRRGGGWALEFLLLAVAVALLFTGAGRFALDSYLGL